MIVWPILLIPGFSFAFSQHPKRANVTDLPSFPNGRVLSNQTGNPSKCMNGTRFFAQDLYHFPDNDQHVDKNIFPQQFQIISDYFEPGGPILFYQGAETGAISCVEYLSLMTAAKELNGLAVTLEHRFFGISTPFGLNFTQNQQWPTSSLSSLTLDNVLLDSVTFVEWIKATFPGAGSSKAIVYGGSYGGFLSAMLRLHYPHTFYGSVTSSGAFNAFFTSSHDPELFAQATWLNSVYYGQSADVAEKIRVSFQTLRKRIAAGQFSGLDRALSLCYPPNSTDQSNALISSLVNGYYVAAQFDYPEGRGSIPAFPLQALINRTNLVQEPLEVLNIASVLQNELNGASCGDWNSVERGGGFDLPFLWIQCQYFPYVNTTYSLPDTIFGEQLPDFNIDNLNDYICRSTFNVKAISGSGLRERYHITQNELENSTRIIFSEGTIDPVTSLGPSPFYTRSGFKDASTMLFIDGGAHGSDLFIPFPGDPQAIVDAVHQEIQIIKGWFQT